MRKKNGASSHPELAHPKRKQGTRIDKMTAEEFQNQHKGKEKDLQEAVESLCGLYGFIRQGTLRDGEPIPADCPGVFFHVPSLAFKVNTTNGENPYDVRDNLKNCPDIVIFRNDGRYLLIELKRKKGKLSAGQKTLRNIVPVVLVSSSDHAEKLIKCFAQRLTFNLCPGCMKLEEYCIC